jgi:hypothetical protein
MLDQLLNGVLPVFGIGAVGYFLGRRVTFPPHLVPRIWQNSLKEEFEWHERDTIKKTF